MASAGKDPNAFRTIGELSEELGVAQHILRYWETKFPQLKPLQRAGNRRYYRPADVDLARRIHLLLAQQGYTVRGAQKLLNEQSRSEQPAPAQPKAPAFVAPPSEPATTVDVEKLAALRDRLLAALEE